MRGFVEDHCRLEIPQHFEPGLAFRCCTGEESLEKETVCRQSGDTERGDHRTWPGHGHNAQTGFTTARDERKTRITDQRGACIGNQRNTPALLEQRKNPVDTFALVVLVQGEHPGDLDTEGIEQLFRVARILGSNEIDLPENLDGTATDIGEIADWRRHDIEHAGPV